MTHNPHDNAQGGEVSTTQISHAPTRTGEERHPCVEPACGCSVWQPPHENPSCRVCGHPRSFHINGYCCGTGCQGMYPEHEFVSPVPTGDCHYCRHPRNSHRVRNSVPLTRKTKRREPTRISAPTGAERPQHPAAATQPKEQYTS